MGLDDYGVGLDDYGVGLDDYGVTLDDYEVTLDDDGVRLDDDGVRLDDDGVRLDDGVPSICPLNSSISCCIACARLMTHRYRGPCRAGEDFRRKMWSWVLIGGLTALINKAK